MRQWLILIVFCSNWFYAKAQRQAVPVSHYLFQNFSNGAVQEKSGGTTTQMLNYNVLTGEMIFDAGGKYLAIAHPENVDTVFIEGRKFIPVNSCFYECLTGSEEPLLIEFTCSIREPGTPTGFGTTTTTASVASLSTLIKTGGAYELKLPDDFKIIQAHNYWIKKGSQYYKVNTAAQLAKLYPAKKGAINEWIKKNNTRFSKPDEVSLLVQQIQ